MERADEDDAAVDDGGDGPAVEDAGVRIISQASPPLPGGGNFPVDLVIARRRAEELARARRQLARSVASGMFIYADSDLKFDQPQAEVVFDRDKLRSQGVTSVRPADLSRLLGANYVNRFSIRVAAT